MREGHYEHIDFDVQMRSIYLDDQCYDILDIDYDQIKSYEMANLLGAQIAFLRGHIDIQLDEKELEMDPKEYLTWSFSARRFKLRLNRQLQICETKKRVLGKEKKAAQRKSMDRALIDALKHRVSDGLFQAALELRLAHIS